MQLHYHDIKQTIPAMILTVIVIALIIILF